MAKIPLGPNPASVKARVRIQDSASSVGAGKTGLTKDSAGLVISVIKDNAAVDAHSYTQAGGTIDTIATLGTWAAPAATKCGFKEVGANHPGLYELHFPDADFASCNSVIVTLKGATGMVETQVEFDCSTLQAAQSEILGATVPGAYGANTLAGRVGNNIDAQISTRATAAQILADPANKILCDALGRVAAIGLPVAPQKAAEFANFMFTIASSVDHVTPLETGVSVTATRIRDNGVEEFTSNQVAYVGRGVYRLTLSAEDTNCDTLCLILQPSAGGDRRTITMRLQS